MAAIDIILSGDILPVRPLNNPPASADVIYQRVRAADLAIGNFEMPLTDRGVRVQKLLNIRAPAALAADVPVLGFDIVTLANNHAVDYGWDGLADTRAGLAAAGLAVIGVGETRAIAAEPVFRDVGGLTIGVIAFSCLTPAGMSAAADRPGLAPVHIRTSYEVDPLYQVEEPGDPSVLKVRTEVAADDLAFAIDAVRAAKAVCDFLVVTIHWGFGSGEDLAEYQPPLGRALIDAGADVVHGHHPHAIHGIGFHAGKPIFFSSGTFIGQQVFLDASPAVHALWAGMSPDGYLASLSIEGAAISAIRLLPTTLDTDRLPVRAEGAIADRIFERLGRLSGPLGAHVTRSGDELLVRPIA
ncbi:poly-gamma-glutamate synthesis protein (capsule biosynthesis protein) [Kaistia hirudinis]|uniref:Poly-gamma-glutamate synthesis protein (Capsule biosynthesis protein) n=1 Tax=Kaistia hirudinis TaxID=1293440 RepID=A0A840ARK9_9HYPH|nr:CapA family protein [Kaistia hirudinis]MBB3932114.1 poly-gamma-glutamate synthesis protein (capsule biosynthesis protein) [Kaistia hirudinis]